ncbi:MAG: hypothetical protein ABI867_11005 [Kofleriaceae bacterium]
MHLRALLMCEDVRLEVDGTLTLIGVYNDRLRGRTPPGSPMIVQHLAFLVVVGGLTGIDRIGFRERIRYVEDDRPAEQPLAYEPHDPRADEHNFVFAHSPMVFPRHGIYDIMVDLEVAMQAETYRHRFRFEPEGGG